MPIWARSRGSAWRLVRTLRQALEAPHTSRELPQWIDLIFGCMQQGEAAVGALNVFLPVTYIGAVDLASLDEGRRAAALSAGSGARADRRSPALPTALRETPQSDPPWQETKPPAGLG